VVRHNNNKDFELVSIKEGLLVVKNIFSNGKDVVLLCGCSDYNKCHRKLIVEYILKEIENVEFGEL